MQLIALKNDYTICAILNPINVQWNRKYYECGDFSIQISSRDYLNDMTYIYFDDRPETGIIQKVEYSETVNGRFIQLSGFFLEKELDDKIINPTFYANGNCETKIKR